jgi:hypothetical protein
MDYSELDRELSKHFERQSELRKKLVKAVNEILTAHGGTVELNDNGDYNGVLMYVTHYDGDFGGSSEVYYVHAATSNSGEPSFVLETEYFGDIREFQLDFDELCDVFEVIANPEKHKVF